MRRAHTVEQVRAAEAALMATLPDGTLMQRAAAGLAYAVIDLLGSAYGRRVRLLVGSGDNGGDALYAGVLLARRGCAVEAWLLSDHAHEAGVAALRAAGGRVVRFTGARYVALRRTTRRGGGRDRRDRRPARAPGRCRGRAGGVGGRPGRGGRRTVGGRRRHRRARRAARRGSRHGHLRHPQGRPPRRPGRVRLRRGHARRHRASTSRQAAVEALQPDDVAALLPRPDQHAHKYTRGVVGVRAGSATYPGAGLLCVAGASTGLCGMVRYVGDAAVADRVRQAHPEVVGDGPGPGLGGRLGRRRRRRRGAGGGRGRRRAGGRRRRRARPRLTARSASRPCSPPTPASWPPWPASTAPTSRPARCTTPARRRRRTTRWSCSRAAGP